MAINTTGDISERVGVKCVKRLLRVGQPLLVTQRFAQMDTQPQNSGKVRKWRRYHSFAVTTAPMAEGVTPAGHGMPFTDYVATLQQFGDVVELTDIVQDTHEDPILKEMVSKSGEQFAKVIEAITIDTLKGGSNVFYASGVASRSLVNAPPKRSDIHLITRAFNRANASPISRMIAPSEKISTAGILPGFYAMGSTDLDADIRAMTGFESVASYGNPGQATAGEMGAVLNVRFILTPNFEPWDASGLAGTTYLANGTAPSGATQADVYPVIVVARDAYACVRLQGRTAVNIMVLNPNTPRGGDPSGQRGSVAWKTMYACAITNESWIARLECACTANPA